MSTRRCIWLSCALFLLLLLAACGGGGGSSKLNLGSGGTESLGQSISVEDLSRELGLQAEGAGGLPAIPVENDVAVSDSREASSAVVPGELGSTRVVQGPDFFEAKNGVVQDGKLVLSSEQGVGLDGVDWAMYRVSGMFNGTPETVNLNCTVAEQGESYFIGVADYTTMSWKWFGPATNTAGFYGFDLSENENRLTSKNGNMYFLLMTPEGNRASHDHTSVTPRTWGKDDCKCKPGCPLNVIASKGEFDNGVQVSWDEADGADTYEVWRDKVTGGHVANFAGAHHGGEHHEDEEDDKTECEPNIAVWFHCDKAKVESSKDLSNVVLQFVDGTKQKFDGLTGKTGEFAGTGEHLKKEILKIWVKSGCNGSNDGPGYGERFSPNYTYSGAVKIAETAETNYFDNQVEENVTYRYRIKARNQKGKSDFCSSSCGWKTECELTEDECPTELTASDGADGDGIWLEWEGGGGNVDHFEVWRACTCGVDKIEFTKIGTTVNTAFLDETAECNKVYRYYIQKICGSKSCKSNTDNGHWLCEGYCPGELVATDCDGDAVHVTWDPGNGYGVFTVFRQEGDAIAILGITEDAEFLDETAVCDLSYTYWVEKIVCGNPCESNTDGGSRFCGDFCPSGLVASDDREDDVELTWNPGDGSGTFEVLRKVKGGGGNFNQIGSVATGAVFVDTTGECDVRYIYQIKKIGPCGDPCYTNEEEGGMECCEYCPTGLVASEDDEECVYLTWDPGCEDDCFWIFRRKVGSTSWTQLGDTCDPQWADCDAECDKTYEYRVKKRNLQTGKECYSNIDQGKLECCDYCPTNVTASDDQEDCIEVNWTHGCELPPGTDWHYKIQRKKVGSSTWTDVGMTQNNTFCDDTAECDKEYSYRIKRWSTGKDCFSDADNGKLECCDYCPTGVTASDDQEDCIEVNWTHGCELPPGTDWHYKVQRKKVGSSNWTDVGMTQNNTFCDDTAECDKEYSYRIKRWSPGQDCFSDPDNGKLECCDFCPTNLVASDGTHDCGTLLNWDGGCGPGTFDIYRKLKGGTSGFKKIGWTTETSFVDETGACNYRYIYKIKKYNEEGENCYTNEDEGWWTSN